nr:pyruvate formate lyase family protein [Collinsella sp. zg1085]
MPQIFNDEVNIPAFIARGIAEQDARDYAIVGCVELSIPGRMYGLHDISMFNMLRCLELTLYNNPEGFERFADLVQAVKQCIAHYIQLMITGCNICDTAHREIAPTPLLSTLIADCLDSGADITAAGARYNPSGVQGVGAANLADSLMVLKYALPWSDVESDQVLCDYPTMLAALKHNWQGAGEELLRQCCIHRFPKYGNDIDEVDFIARDFLAFYGHEVEQYSNVRGGYFQPGSYTVSAHVPLGHACGASPDGRVAHEQLADGGLSPMIGRDVHGPTASLKSVSKLENHLDSNGSLLNVKFSPASLEGASGLQKLSSYIKSFGRLGIQHIQFNVIDRKTLRAAQEHPDKYKNLVVRVAGYSAMFVELSREIQNDIIGRSEHELS